MNILRTLPPAGFYIHTSLTRAIHKPPYSNRFLFLYHQGIVLENKYQSDDQFVPYRTLHKCKTLQYQHADPAFQHIPNPLTATVLYHFPYRKGNYRKQHQYALNKTLSVENQYIFSVKRPDLLSFHGPDTWNS